MQMLAQWIHKTKPNWDIQILNKKYLPPSPSVYTIEKLRGEIECIDKFALLGAPQLNGCGYPPLLAPYWQT